MSRPAKYYAFTVSGTVLAACLALVVREVYPRVGLWGLAAVVVLAGAAMWIFRDHAKQEPPAAAVEEEPRPQLGGGIFVSHSSGAVFDGAVIDVPGPALVVHKSDDFKGRDLDIRSRQDPGQPEAPHSP